MESPLHKDISKASATSIARSLLYIASCLQQLDPEFDTSQLKLSPSVDTRMERYVSAVQHLVTCDEELVSSVEGLDCLILQCSYRSNAGNPRRAWLTLRKAMNIAQLRGLHLPSCTIPGGRQIWAHIIQGDRYLALLLGLPAGSKDTSCGPEETLQNTKVSEDECFDLTIRIIERNQNEQAHTYTATHDIDEVFENLAAEMRPDWWDVPEDIPQDHSRTIVQSFDRLMFQIIYFQFVALLHLPFMLRAAKERRYEYSKFSCMKSSREMINRYLALRHTTVGTFCCRIIDFGAFTATVTIFLGLLEPSSSGDSRDKQQRDSDRNLVDMVLKSMEEIGQPGKDLVAKQSASAIRSLLAITSPSGLRTTNLKLSIPYFGTIRNSMRLPTRR
ncbi:hypothetical protein V1520DRAFT_316116 [Lipomyces starkeyi]|uniref:Transcription factor domain-containing protein n=1 Tax=Lipomyces starkeyi NRRL Y-11557 TaxID=675824 RepID=A0A1E3PZX9_LIPST|nr:hypothetical protein LIPSTDRAFT_332742 [Lipomyces starkeyi NRRL Y-11557]